MFSVRIVTADYYMGSPLPGLDPCQSSFREAPARRVPVVRVFGATPAGQKTCLHLHGIFPYLYVPYDGFGQHPEHHLRQVAFSIDRALNVALGNPSSTVQHVFKVSLVSGMPFYGYHEKERQFMKIYLYNPAMVKRVCELLQGGAIMNKSYQPHEAHIPYLLQLFIDYNLYGMNLINLAAVKFRKARRKSDTSGVSKHHRIHLSENSSHVSFTEWEEDEIPSSLMLKGVEPQSTCELEVDAVAADILNQLDIEAQIGRNPGLQAIWEDEKQRRRQKCESSQIKPPESQDRGFVPATESEKFFQKRLKEILKQNDFSVTLSGSLDYSNGSEEFSAELTLHSEVLSPEAFQCTPANMVEVHDDKKMNKDSDRVHTAKEEEALINEEAILNIVENSQSFQPLSQRLNQTTVFMGNSADEAMIDLLAGLENDGYQMEHQKTLSHHRSLGSCRNTQNSDDEENEPQCEKEEMELSLLMSQRWDTNMEEPGPKRRSAGKNVHRSSTEEDSSSEEEMEWSGNSMLLTNLSIPQLDGTADENGDNPLNNESSRTHSSVIATSKMSVKTSIFHKDAATLEPPSSAKITFQCKHTSALSNHVLNNEDFVEDLSKPNTETRPELSVHSLTKESTYSAKYPAPFSNSTHAENSHKESNKKDTLPVPSCGNNIFDYEDDISSVNRPIPSRKYISIRKADKDVSFMHVGRHIGDSMLNKNLYSFSDLSHSKGKMSSEVNEKSSSASINNFFPATVTENCELVSCSGGSRTVVHSLENNTDEGGLNKLKIRYEEFQEHKAEKPSLSQQAAHYMFFPSVVLSNCLNRPQKLAPVTYKLQQGNKQSRLKLNKKKHSFISHQEPASINDVASVKESCYTQGNACSNIPDKDSALPSDLVQVPLEAFENKMPTSTANYTDCQFADGSLETEQSFGLCGNKYTLRTKRKVNYETEDSELSFVAHNTKINLPQPIESVESSDGSQKSRKRRKLSKKLPPVIIKYIIINRFRGRKNMLVKLGKVDSSEERVVLTEEKLNLYKKLAPLKDFWPKVPDSPATKYPIYPLTPKKSHKRKAKHKSTKKKAGKPQKTGSTNIKRTLAFRKRTHAILSPPSPSYSAEAEDCDYNYSDVMSKLGFLSERSTSPVNTSPPRCWSPTDPKADEILTNLDREALFSRGPNMYSSKTVNTSVGKNSRAKTQVKKCKKKFASPTVSTKKKKKINQADKTPDDGKKKPRTKQRQKTAEKVSSRKRVVFKDEKGNSCSTAEVKFVLKHQDLPEISYNSVSSQPLHNQKDSRLSGYSTGYLPSAQFPSAADAQDPGFESCYSLEDSLSPDHNYNFDINTIGQSGFCSFYSASQFVPADQNLPQKFLSDAVQDLGSGQTAENDFPCHNDQKSEEEKQHSSSTSKWIRSGSLSPELFEKTSLDNNENHCHSQWRKNIHSSTSRSSFIDTSCTPETEICLNEKFKLNRNTINKERFLNLSQPTSSDWIPNHIRKETTFEPCQPLDSVSTSFTSILSSPDGELIDVASEDLELHVSRNSETLTPTPDSSPRSTSSPSQSKNGSFTPRTAHILKPLMSPPSREEIMATLLDHDLAETVYQEPFCSNPSDAPEKPREIGGRLLTVETRLPNDLLEFEGDFSLEGLRLWKTAFSAMTESPRPGSPPHYGHSTVNKRENNSHNTSEDKKIVIMPCKCAPSQQQVQIWLHAKEEYEHFKKLPKNHPAELAKAAENFSSTVLSEEKSIEVIKVAKDLNLSSLEDERPIVPTKNSPASVAENTKTQTKETCDKSISAIGTSVNTENDIDSNKTSCESKTLITSALEHDKEEEEEDYYVNYSSPDSPVLPPWQQVASPDPKQSNLEDTEWKNQDIILSSVEGNDAVPVGSAQNSPSTQEDSRTSFDTSPFPVNEDPGNSICLHSTPIVQRKNQDGIPEVLGFTPLSAEPKAQKLSHKRGNNTDGLRRVLLTTQMKNQFAALGVPKKDTSQIEGPTLNNTYGFKVSVENLQEAKSLHEVQHLTLISMELHARTRRDLEPDPEFDPICALFYCVSSDTALPNTDKKEITGAIVIDRDRTLSSQGSRDQAPLLTRSGVTGLEVSYATDERTLFQEVVNIVKRYDPDILLGYEVQMHSWGYLLQRAAALNVDLCQMISRVPDEKKDNRFAQELDEYGSDTMSEINIVGRIMLNIWRMMRNEVNLTNYTFENVGFHVLHHRFPLFTFRVLSDWFDNKADVYRWKMVDHYVSRVRGNLLLLEKLDLIDRTSEMARLFGIQFLHVLTRGSQYRVESVMLRIAKPMNYIAVTPSVQQRAQMKAPQCVPLIMEPESRFYSNAVLVLDFQSLYPSIVIAYNYCFSTCLGHVENLGKYDAFKFGCTSLRVPPDLLYQIRHDITVSPSGVAFVKPSVRKGVLPRMLEEILKTRIMVKQSMKAYKHDKAVTRMLEARQLGLKYIANFTFGYTAANFSGRMPCIEIGDSIVHKARETLERAIKLVNDTKKWGAHVVYGDTDSMFVLLKGATKEQSFKIGQEIAEAVTATNPKPVKLKFEKVYLPCVLQTKKRYVGYMYETLDQKDPVFDAKGIETVRRDSCPAVSKILECSIKLLFETRDISQIKQYVQNQCMKLLEGKASMQDFIFAKEYRGSSAYRPGACVPALEITRRMLAYDRRSEPRVGERVPYVIVYGMPGLPLIQLVRRPIEVLQDPNLRLNATYYITKQILPPLARVFSLIGIDVFSWYHELPRIQKAASAARTELEGRKGTISQYFTTLHCPVCDELTQYGICNKCRSQPQHVAVILNQEIRELERKQEQLVKICKNCTGCFDRQIPCVSLNCPILFKLSRVSRELSKAPYLRQLLDQF
ncbi:DNA polymerase zeta catalytic subunit isoform X2 [Myiozetetes cayanensis]|uniref:DNA polymerase zeta catalytic subunit isoform X2 n=1 Tax=Myiozetetes cayanensis TaxID=478635 RepID=UPI00216004DD|nr:DNA polymerase zeta catalytic subunit isoform X2 [Myiozetetes cayanensis]